MTIVIKTRKTGVTLIRTVGLIAALALTIAAQPRLTASYSGEQGFLLVTVRGKSVPESRGIELEFGYDPAMVDLPESVVSSPVPQTAFGAFLDTAEKILTINVMAASTIKVADSGVISLLRAPLAGSAAGAHSIELRKGVVIDRNGARIDALVSTAAREPAHGVAYFNAKGINRMRKSTMYSLDGRAAPFTGRRSAAFKAVVEPEMRNAGSSGKRLRIIFE